MDQFVPPYKSCQIVGTAPEDQSWKSENTAFRQKLRFHDEADDSRLLNCPDHFKLPALIKKQTETVKNVMTTKF